MSRLTLEDNPTRNMRLEAPRYPVVRQVLTGALSIPYDGATIYELNPNGADRTVQLPTPSVKGGKILYIKNIGSANVLNVVDHLGAAVTSIASNGMSTFISGTTSWSLLTSSPLYVPDGTEALPGLAFSADTNNGIYRIAADDWGLVAGGNRLIRLTGTGNIATAVVAFNGTKAATAPTIAAVTFAGGIGAVGGAIFGGPVLSRGENSVYAPNQAIFEYAASAGGVRFGATGADASTNGNIIFYTIRSNGTNYLTPLTIAASGQVRVTTTTSSTTHLTGALLVAGGLGIAGRTSTATLAVGTATQLTNPNFQIQADAQATGGNMNDAANMGQLTITGATDTGKRLILAYDTTSNLGIIKAGRSGIGFDTIRVVNSPLELTGTTASVSTGTGQLIVSGGIGAAGALHVGANSGTTPQLVCYGRFQVKGNAGDTSAVIELVTSGGATRYVYAENSGTGGLILQAITVRVIGTVGFWAGSGNGGTVTQNTSKSTGVTLDKSCGQITMNNAALNAATSVSFTLTNSTIAATDVVQVNIASGATADAYTVTVTAVAAGSCRIQIRNESGGSLSEALVLNFFVFKCVTN